MKTRQTGQLSVEQMQQLQMDRAAIAKELPRLMSKHRRLRQAAAMRTTSGALRRAIHSSRFLLHDLAARCKTDLATLDSFLTGEHLLTSDVIDRLSKLLNLSLQPVNIRPKPRQAKAG